MLSSLVLRGRAFQWRHLQLLILLFLSLSFVLMSLMLPHHHLWRLLSLSLNSLLWQMSLESLRLAMLCHVQLVLSHVSTFLCLSHLSFWACKLVLSHGLVHPVPSLLVPRSLLLPLAALSVRTGRLVNGGRFSTLCRRQHKLNRILCQRTKCRMS